jgi:hypothetical protein
MKPIRSRRVPQDPAAFLVGNIAARYPDFIRIFVIETHEQAGEFKEPLSRSISQAKTGIATL